MQSPSGSQTMKKIALGQYFSYDFPLTNFYKVLTEFLFFAFFWGVLIL